MKTDIENSQTRAKCYVYIYRFSIECKHRAALKRVYELIKERHPEATDKIPVTKIEYGDPDGLGDLKRKNEFALKVEVPA